MRIFLSGMPIIAVAVILSTSPVANFSAELPAEAAQLEAVRVDRALRIQRATPKTQVVFSKKVAPKTQN